MVYFLDETFEELQYDASTTVMEAVEALAGQIKLENYQTFSLFAVQKVREAQEGREAGCGDATRQRRREAQVAAGREQVRDGGTSPQHTPARPPPLQGKGDGEVGAPVTDEHVLCDDNRFVADIM